MVCLPQGMGERPDNSSSRVREDSRRRWLRVKRKCLGERRFPSPTDQARTFQCGAHFLFVFLRQRRDRRSAWADAQPEKVERALDPARLRSERERKSNRVEWQLGRLGCLHVAALESVKNLRQKSGCNIGRGGNGSADSELQRGIDQCVATHQNREL